MVTLSPLSPSLMGTDFICWRSFEQTWAIQGLDAAYGNHAGGLKRGWRQTPRHHHPPLFFTRYTATHTPACALSSIDARLCASPAYSSRGVALTRIGHRRHNGTRDMATALAASMAVRRALPYDRLHCDDDARPAAKGNTTTWVQAVEDGGARTEDIGEHWWRAGDPALRRMARGDWRGENCGTARAIDIATCPIAGTIVAFKQRRARRQQQTLLPASRLVAGAPLPAYSIVAGLCAHKRATDLKSCCGTTRAQWVGGRGGLSLISRRAGRQARDA